MGYESTEVGCLSWVGYGCHRRLTVGSDSQSESWKVKVSQEKEECWERTFLQRKTCIQSPRTER